MTSPRPKLTFKMRLPDTPETTLISGMLYLQLKDQIQQQFKCTSGYAGKQFKAAQVIKGVGPLPSSELIKPREYMVATHAHIMDQPGHMGARMFSIYPNRIKVGAAYRGEFGIHKDLNYPGTVGCIGLPEAFQWILFDAAMERLAAGGLNYVPLTVVYY